MRILYSGICAFALFFIAVGSPLVHAADTRIYLGVNNHGFSKFHVPRLHQQGRYRPGQTGHSPVIIYRASPSIIRQTFSTGHRSSQYPYQAQLLSPKERYYQHLGRSRADNPLSRHNRLNSHYLLNNASGYNNQAWLALVHGQRQIALRQFNQQCRQQPANKLLRAGLALSTLATGQHRQGKREMRRAFRDTTDSMLYYTRAPELMPLLSELILLYDNKPKKRHWKKDDAFMLGALNYMRQDYENGLIALEHARHAGDRSQSFRNLLGYTLYRQKSAY